MYIRDYSMCKALMYTSVTRIHSSWVVSSLMGLLHKRLCMFVIIHHEVATTSRLLKIIRLFCKRALQKRAYPAKEIYKFKEPTNRSHPIAKTSVGHSYTHCVTRIRSSWVVSVHMQDMCGHPYTRFVTHVQSS